MRHYHSNDILENITGRLTTKEYYYNLSSARKLHAFNAAGFTYDEYSTDFEDLIWDLPGANTVYIKKELSPNGRDMIGVVCLEGDILKSKDSINKVLDYIDKYSDWMLKLKQ